MKKYWDKIINLWNKLTLASKIVLILWTLNAFYMLFSDKSDVNFLQWLIIWLFCSFLLVWGTQLISKKKRKTSFQSKYAEKALAPTDSLPVILTSNLLLSDGEICHYYEHATFVKTKNVVVGYSGGSHGTSIRVAKGISFRVGASKAAPVRGNVQEKTDGILSITNKRIIFSANKGAFDKKISALSAVTPYQGGIAFQFGEHQYPLETKESEYIFQILNRLINTSKNK